MPAYKDFMEDYVSLDVGESASASVLQGAAMVKDAVSEELATSSSTNCTRIWRRFMSYCMANNFWYLPAKPDMVALNFGHLAR